MINAAFHLRGFRFITGLILLAIVYLVAGHLGLRFAVIHGNVTLIWPPAGIALAALVLFGRRMWPGVWLGAFLVIFSTGLPPPAALMIATGNTLGVVAAASLLKSTRFHPAIERVRDVLALLGLAAILSTMISATIGVLTLIASGLTGSERAPLAWLDWWAGEAIGVLALAPLLLTWGNNRRVQWGFWQRIELLALVLIVIIASQYVFSDRFAAVGFYPLSFLILPFLLWVAVRFGQRETATLAVFVFTLAIWQTARQSGLLSPDSINHSALLLWNTYTAVVTVMTMLVAAIMASHKRVERALAEERDFATQIMDAMGHGVVVTDREGRLEYVNPAYARMLGYRPYELMGRKTSDVSASDNSFLSPGFLKAHAGKPLAYETRLRRRDGTIMEALVGGTVRLREGELNGSIVAVTDLTDIKQTEQALRQSEGAARAFLDQLKVLHALSMELARADTFDNLCRLAIELGHSGLDFERLGLWFLEENRDFILGSFYIDETGQLRDERGARHPRTEQNFPLESGFINIDNMQVSFLADTDLLNDRGEVVRRGWRAIGYMTDGERIIGALFADNFFSGKPIEPFQLEILALFGDVLGNFITRKRAELASQESEARFRSVYEGAGMGIAVVDRNGYVVMSNPAYQYMVGYSADELREMTFVTLTHPDDRSDNVNLFEGLVSGKSKGYEYEKRYIRKDGSIIPIHMHVTLFPDRDQPLVIAMIEDISRRKKAEEALYHLNNQLEQRIVERTAELQAANERLTELDRLKTKFIADVSHELRTPLAVLNTRVYLLQRSPPEKWPGYLHDLTHQVERLTNFTNTILDLSRIELGKDKITFGPVDLPEVARQVVAALKPRAEVAGLNLTCECLDGLPAVRGEFNQLSQVVTNLVANAINYTANGSIKVEVAPDSDGTHIQFEVQDTGIGIPQDDLPHLFNRFYRAANTAQSNIPGSGLGLSIVKEIVDLHEGHIQVESQVGRGTTFRVLLPIFKAGRPSPELNHKELNGINAKN